MEMLASYAAILFAIVLSIFFHSNILYLAQLLSYDTHSCDILHCRLEDLWLLLVCLSCLGLKSPCSQSFSLLLQLCISYLELFIIQSISKLNAVSAYLSDPWYGYNWCWHYLPETKRGYVPELLLGMRQMNLAIL